MVCVAVDVDALSHRTGSGRSSENPPLLYLFGKRPSPLLALLFCIRLRFFFFFFEPHQIDNWICWVQPSSGSPPHLAPPPPPPLLPETSRYKPFPPVVLRTPSYGLHTHLTWSGFLVCIFDGRRQLVDGSLRALLRPGADDADSAAAGSSHKWRMVIAYDGTKFKGFSRPSALHLDS